MTDAPVPLPPRERVHAIDALRVIALLLLILYHAGMAYVADWDFHLKSAYTAEWLEHPMRWLNRWRMPLLFLLSGLALGLLLPQGTDGASRWRRFRERSWRLLLPLVFGMLVVVPVQPYVEAVANGAIAPGFVDFLARYLRFQPWPEGSFAGATYGFTWNHLWYLPYLWTYTALALLALPLLDWRPVRAAGDWLAARGPLGLALLLAVPAFLAFHLLGDRFPSTHALEGDWFNHAHYGAVFLSGLVLARGGAAWPRLASARWWLLGAVLAVGVAYFSWMHAVRDTVVPLAPLLAIRALRALYMALALLAILGWGLHAFARPPRWLPWAREAVFPVYILHQSLTLWLLHLLAPHALGPVLEPALVVGGTLVLALALHEGLIRRVGWLRPLFGLGPRRA